MLHLNRKSRRRAAALARKQSPKTPLQRSTLSRNVAAPLAAGALMLATPQLASAQVAPQPQCVINGTTVTCTGDLEDGVSVISPNGANVYDTLIINNVDAPGIAPAPGVDGVSFQNAGGPITVNIDTTGTDGIITNGDTAIGIEVEQTTGNGDVIVNSIGNISTSGNQSEGIDVGRNGGIGDIIITSNGDITTSGTNSEGFNIEQDGGTGILSITSIGNISILNGDDGIYASHSGVGAVFISTTGDILTTGNAANAVDVDQADGDVTIISEGNLTTTGVNSDAIDVEVTGGTGVINVMSTGNITTDDGVAILLNHDGDGDIIVTSNGLISTNGGGSDGISADISLATSTGNINVSSTGNITTLGANAEGIVTTNAGTGNITINSTGNITTSGVNSEGILAQQTGTNGNVTVISTGSITTSGNLSNAVDAEVMSGDILITSIGNLTTYNGTGIDADTDFFAGTGNVTIMSTGDITNTGTSGDGIDANTGGGNVSITSEGDINVDGYGIDSAIFTNGNITVVSTGNITARDFDAINLFIFGDGDISLTTTGDVTALDNIGIDLGGIDNGNITLNSIGNITSNTDDAVEVSLTNGSININSQGAISSAEEGFDVDVSGNGSITLVNNGTINAVENGISALVGGVGDIAINTTGNITAGAGFDGIAITNNVTGSNTIDLNGGIIQGGTGAGAGVNLTNALGSSTINILSTNTISSGSGNAILGGAGDDIINNSGILNTVTNGTINLGAGTNAFNNLVGGTFNSGATINLGAGNVLTNDGILSPGGTDTIQTSALTGQLVQSTIGTFAVDVDLTAGTPDLLTVSETASLSGNVQVNVLNPALGPQQNTILTATGGVTNNGLGLLASPALQAELLFPNATDVVLSTDIDFAAPGAELSPNQTAVANTLNGALAGGIGAFDPIFDGLLNDITDNAGFQAALDSLSGEIHATSQFALNSTGLFVGDSITNLLDGFGSADNLSNGNQTASVATLQALALAPGETAERLFAADLPVIDDGDEEAVQPQRNRFVFSRGLFRDVSIDDDGNGGETDIQNRGFIAGGGINFDNRFQAGLGVGYLRSEVDVDSLNSEVEADSAIISAFGRFNDGAFDASATLGYIYSDVDSSRGVAVGAFTAIADADYDSNTVFGSAEFGYTKFVDRIALRPFVSGGFSVTNRDGFTETGAGAANLVVASETDALGQFSIGASASTSFTIKSALIVPRIELAFDQLIGDVTPGSTAQFQPGGAAFTVVGAEPGSSRGRVNVGAATKFSERITGFLEYQGVFSGSDTEHAVRSGLRFRF